MEARELGALREELDRLRAEVAELRASRERLVVAADADRRRIERDLHEGVQQHLVALAVNLQLCGPLLEADPAGAKALVEEMRRDVQRALDDTALLAERVYPPLLEIGGLAAALRSAAVSAGVTASVDVSAGSACPPEVVRTVYFCWLDALERTAGGTRATVTVREEGGALCFELVNEGARPAAAGGGARAGLDGLRDRVEALGGRLTVDTGRARVYGSLPVMPDPGRSPPGR